MSTAPRSLRLVGPCVFLSGAASLGLEVVWSRSLKLVFGSTTLAITTILVAYMLGLGLGGLVGGRIAGRLKNGIRAYGWIEIGIGLYAFAVPSVLGLYPELHRALLAPLSFWPSAFVRFLLVGVIFLGPTLCMGATLPILVQGLAVRDQGIARRVGWLYGLNTLGAVAGVLGATFVAFPRLGLQGTNTFAATLDIVVGGFAVFWLAKRLPERALKTAPAKEAVASEGRRGARGILFAYGVVGCTALAYEVAWTRALSMVLGSSIYAFATMLAGFLAGIAIGSLIARSFLDRISKPREFFAWGIALLGLASLGVAALLTALPNFFLATIERTGITSSMLVWMGLAISFVVMLAPTLILGALFPLATRLVAEESFDDGTAVGRVYFANTVGSALGAFVTGFIAIPLVGLRWTMGAAIGIDLAVAGLLFLGAVPRRPLVGFLALAGALFVCVRPPVWNAEDFAIGVYYRASTRLDFGVPPLPLEGVPGDEMLFYEEGINCTVSVHRTEGGLDRGGVSMRINGKADASLKDMSTQVLSGHIPVLFGGSDAKRALVIGYASGVTSGSATLYDFEDIDVCEIEGAVMRAAEFFDDYNHRPLLDPRVEVLVEDGRTLIETNTDPYDVIISEPSNPWISGCSNLFTAEFFTAAKAALEPDGSLLQWVQLYGMGKEGLRSILTVMGESFDYVYGFLYDVDSTDLMLIASDKAITEDELPRWGALPQKVQEDLARVRIFSTAELWSLMYLLPEDVDRITSKATVRNTDDSMYVELAAPWYLYEDTPGTLDLVLEEASGILPLIQELELEEGLLGELAVAYVGRRLDDVRSEAIKEELSRRGDRSGLATYAATRIIHVDGGEARDALALLNEACVLAPQGFQPAYTRGWLMNRIGRYGDALRDLDRALSLRPLNSEVRHQRMKSLGALDQMKVALDETDHLLNSPLVETEPRLWAEGAILYGGFGRFEEATRRMETYLRLEPYSPDQWEQLAFWYERMGRSADAARAKGNVDKARTNLIRESHWVARWHMHFGDPDQAVLALEEILEVDPDNEEAKNDLESLRP